MKGKRRYPTTRDEIHRSKTLHAPRKPQPPSQLTKTRCRGPRYHRIHSTENHTGRSLDQRRSANASIIAQDASLRLSKKFGPETTCRRSDPLWIEVINRCETEGKRSPPLVTVRGRDARALFDEGVGKSRKVWSGDGPVRRIQIGLLRMEESAASLTCRPQTILRYVLETYTHTDPTLLLHWRPHWSATSGAGLETWVRGKRVKEFLWV